MGNGIMGTLKFWVLPRPTTALLSRTASISTAACDLIDVGGNTATLTGVVSDSVVNDLMKTGPGTLLLPVANMDPSVQDIGC